MFNNRFLRFFKWSVLFAVVPMCSVAHAASSQWIATWGSSQMRGTSEARSSQELSGATLRQVVHLSAGGDKVRLHFSNAFGERSLLLDKVEIARRSAQGKDGIQPDSRMAVRFGGSTSATIPMGAEYLSDEIALPVAPLSDLVISIVVKESPANVTLHPGARATSYLLHGDHVADVTMDSATPVMQWYFLAGVEVASAKSNGSLVALGDSITDGHGATTDANERWTDYFARKIAGSNLGVVNQGIGGNRILADGLGPNALSRFDRDVLAIPGVRTLVVLEGINDLGGLDRVEAHPVQAHENLVHALEAALRQMAERAHAHNIRVIAGTVMPFLGSDYYHPNEQTEADRQSLNQWIRTSGLFDAVIDFDQIMRDPSNPGHLATAVDSGDHLHPSPAGYKRMGEAAAMQLLQ